MVSGAEVGYKCLARIRARMLLAYEDMITLKARTSVLCACREKE